jgi:beta-lactamase regulating signal transducer with metallopeptidase domain
MTDWSPWLAYRLAELLCHSTLLLTVVLLLLPWIRQPARRVVLCRGGLFGLALLVVLPGVRGRAAISLPDWARVAVLPFQEPAAGLQHTESESAPIAAIERATIPFATTKQDAQDDGPVVVHGTDTGADFGGAVPDESAAGIDDGSVSHESPGDRVRLPVEVMPLSSEPFAKPTLAWPWELVSSMSWMIGGLGATIWITIGAWRTWSLVRHSHQAAEWIYGELKLVVPERCRPPRLRVNDRIESALVCGTWRPAILLPECKTQLPEGEGPPAGGTPTGIRAALAHEWAHIANGDLWHLALERLLLPVYLMQPLFWFLRRRIRIDQELLADAAAAGESPVEYAEALLAWAKSTSAGPRGEVLAVLSFWNNPCHLPRRIEMLIDTTNRVLPQASRLWRGTTLTIVFALACGLSLLTLGTKKSVAESHTDDAAISAAESGDLKQSVPPAATDSPEASKPGGTLSQRTSEDGPAAEGEASGDSPNPPAAKAKAEGEAIRTRERYEYVRRLAKKGYAPQGEVDAARAELERAKAALEAAQKKAAEATDIDDLRKLIDELREENRLLRQKLPPENTKEPDAKGVTEDDGPSLELQLLELDVNEAEVDVAGAKTAYDQAVALHAKAAITFAEVSTRKLALQKAEIALQRAKLRVKAAQRPSTKLGHQTPAPNLPKDNSNPGEGAAKQESPRDQRQVVLHAQLVALDRAALDGLRAKFGGQTAPGSLGQFFSDMSLYKRTTVTAILEPRQLADFREAIQPDPKARILAEPRLTLRSGEKAGFSSMREFKVPMAKEKITDSALDFTLRGVGFALFAVATIQDHDLIRLQLLPEFSAIDPGKTVDGVPGLITWRVQTTVELRPGQTIALAGMLPAYAKGNSSRFTGPSELPAEGKLPERQDLLQDSELLILVTPEIVQASSLPVQVARPDRKVPGNGRSLMEETALLVQRMLGLTVAVEPVSISPLPLAGKFSRGFKVSSVESDGPAEGAGIRVDDVLVGIHIWEIKHRQDLKYALTNWNSKELQTTTSKTGALHLILLRGTETVAAELQPRP